MAKGNKKTTKNIKKPEQVQQLTGAVHSEPIGSKEIIIEKSVDIEPITQYVLYAVLISRIVIQPIYSLISDCDETFNYWEPLNYMVRGFGKQTWEYSPIYAIRSWCFLLPLFNILKVSNKVFGYFENDFFKPYHLFYLARFVLGGISYLVEKQFFMECSLTFSADFGKWWLILQLFNPGYFHSSVELLPSSFAMILMIHSTNYYIKYVSQMSQGTKKLEFFVKSVACIIIGAIAGWPFVFVMILPIAIHFMLNNFNNPNFVFKGIINCAKSLIVIVAYITLVDSLFYGKLAPVFFNIVAYNVFNATEESGPNIFGIEPWYYYFQNLILNFPLITLLALIISFLVVFSFQFFKKCWPIYLQVLLWIGIFNNQPHKEERFLYPIYGLVTFLATIPFVAKTETLSKKNGKSTKNTKVAPTSCFKKTFKFLCFCALAVQSILRISSLIINYTGPLSVYEYLNHLPSSQQNVSHTDVESTPINVCVGREWYHFPTSFFLPDNYRLKFVASGFDGLLPGDFKENMETWVAGIRVVPEGMNNLNQFDEGKLIPFNQCDYLLDVELENYNEDDSINKETKGDRLYCSSIIDVENSKLLGRSFTIPFFHKLPESILKYTDKFYHVEYLGYCLYETKSQY